MKQNSRENIGNSIFRLPLLTILLQTTAISCLQIPSFGKHQHKIPLLRASTDLSRSVTSHLTLSSSNNEDFFSEITEPTGSPKQKQPEPSRDPLYIPEPSSSGALDERIPKLNTVTLSGRIGNLAEPKYFDNGKCVLNLSLAVKRKYHPMERMARDLKYGEEETDWFNLEIWGRDAEFISKFITKGARLGVTGGLSIDTWMDKSTSMQRKRARIVVKHVDILETKAESNLRQGNQNSGGYDNKRDSGNGQRDSGQGGFFD